MALRILPFPAPQLLPSVAGVRRVGDIPTTSIRKSLPSNCVVEGVSNASLVGLGCIRGVVLGLAFEAAIGIVVYAVWQLCRFL
jgi:hypothetical protein